VNLIRLDVKYTYVARMNMYRPPGYKLCIYYSLISAHSLGFKLEQVGPVKIVLHWSSTLFTDQKDFIIKIKDTWNKMLT
jgi:hypothetical protein